MLEVFVDVHAFKHGVAEEDIRYAWSHFVCMQFRGAPREGEVLAIGPDRKGRLMQIVGVERSFGILIFHAMIPPTDKAYEELGISRG